MDRLLVAWCPALLGEAEDGEGTRLFEQVVEVMSGFSPAVDLVAPGVGALTTRGPSRYFGGDEALARQLAEAVAGRCGTELQVGVADGLFAAVLAARRATTAPLVVGRGQTAAFLASWPVDVLGVSGPDGSALAELLHRLGLHDLGAFAALPTRHVLARLGAAGARCHQVAGGHTGELPGLRAPVRGGSRGGRPAGAEDEDSHHSQPGFWGEAAAAEARVGRAAARVAGLLGPTSVVVGRLQGGRGPRDRARMVPWTSRHLDPGPAASGPWPGRIPPPAPVVVLQPPVPVALSDEDGHPVDVTGAGLATTSPARLSVDGGPWTALSGWAGPWPADERWWSTRRRRAHMQVVTTAGAAYLLVRERGRWWMEGAYD